VGQKSSLSPGGKKNSSGNLGTSSTGYGSCPHITQTLLKQEAEIKVSCTKLAEMKKTYWRMKSRALWLQDGDKNTAFFHKHTQSRINYNSIEEIHWQEQVYNDAHSIKEAAHNYFKTFILSRDGSLGPSCLPDFRGAF
jgi:hypothetical protein